MAENVGREISIESNKLNLSRYRAEIDGLRAFAVVAVIINHFNKDILPGGYLGVDIFFVISGYVITSSLFGRPSKDFKDFISGFYERRIKRLVPALSVFVLIASIAICLFNPYSGVQLGIGKRALFGLSNIALYQQSTDYFSPSTELNIFTHTWSLGVEEQFYILFPFLIWFSGFGRQTKNGARNLFLIVGAMTIASLTGFLYLYTTNQPAAYFLMPWRFWEMAVGCLIFIGFQKKAIIEQILEKVPPLLVMALIVGVMYLPMSMAYASTIAVVVLSSILIACLKQQTAAFKVFTTPKVVYIGLISYSLYLWHWGVLSISRWTIGIHWWSVPFQVALMLGLAIASYKWIETPLRKGNWSGKRWKTLLVGGGVLVAVFGGLVALGKPLKGSFYLGEKTREKTSSELETFSPCYGTNISLSDATKNCSSQGTASNGQTIWLVGDSHAQRLMPKITAYAKSKHINYFVYSAQRTSFPSVAHMHSRISLRKENIAWSANYMKEIEKHILKVANVNDIVVIAIRHPYHFGNSERDFPSKGFSFLKASSDSYVEDYSKSRYRKKYENLLLGFVDAASRNGINTVIIGPQPEFNDLSGCMTPEWFNMLSKKCFVNRNDYYGQQEIIEIFNMLERISSSSKNFFSLDASKVLCVKSDCKYVDPVNNESIYIDNNHLSPYGSSLIVDEIERFLGEMNLIVSNSSQ